MPIGSPDNSGSVNRSSLADKVLTGLTVVDLLTTSAQIPLTPAPDLSRTHTQGVTRTVPTPAADAPLPLHPGVAALAENREKMLREQRKREMDRATAERGPRSAERRPDTRSTR